MQVWDQTFWVAHLPRKARWPAPVPPGRQETGAIPVAGTLATGGHPDPSLGPLPHRVQKTMVMLATPTSHVRVVVQVLAVPLLIHKTGK